MNRSATLRIGISRTTSFFFRTTILKDCDTFTSPFLSLSRLPYTSWMKRLLYHTYSIWLFTFSDLKTIACPSTVFGVVNGLISTSSNVTHQRQVNILCWILCKSPIVFLWVWINLLPFDIDNQRQDASIQEDAANKPWRTLPSKRMTNKQATKVMVCFYVLAWLVSSYLGGMRQAAILLVLGYCYNDLGGADVSCVCRNLINACGFICFISGALEVSLGQKLHFDSQMTGWLGLIFITVFLTVHTQDMYDQAGDSLRGRKTVPLELGDTVARWTIALSMVPLSWLCPRFWDLPPLGYIITISLGWTVAARSLTMRTVHNDKKTFRIWNLWMASLYALPALKAWIS